MLLKHKHKVTIITPVFNEEGVIKETADSILSQGFTEIEWLIVNDGSDNSTTIQLLNKLSLSDPRVRVIHHEQNRGLSAARNTGIKAAMSEYLFFLDADDLIHKTYIEKAFLVLENSPNHFFVNSYVKGFGEQTYLWEGGFHDNEIFLKENRNTSCFMARKEVFEKILFDESMRDGCEDWDFWLNAASNNFWGFTIPEYLFFYRRTNKSKWGVLNNSGKLNEIRVHLNAKYGKAIFKYGFPKSKENKYEFGRTGKKHIPLTSVSNDIYNPQKMMCFFPWLEIGGADLFNLRLLQELKKVGWGISIVTTLKNKHKLSNDFEKVSNNIFHLANLGGSTSYSTIIRYLIEKNKPSIIFLSNSMYGYFLLPWVKMNFPDIQVVDFVHCEDPGWYNGGYPFFSATYTNCLDKTFVSSNQLGGWCIERGADRNKIETCYINVDTKIIRRDPENRKRIRNQLGLADSTRLILYVARLTAQKQPKMVVEVLSRIGNENSDYKCIIIGDGPEKSALLMAIKKHNLNEQILFLGAQSNGDVMSYMDAADIFFLPSLYEGIALSIYEAMAKSLAIVGADTGGQKELVTEECGVLINETEKQGEIEKYAMVLIDLLKDPGQITKMGKASRLRVEQLFDSSKMVSQMHRSLSGLRMNSKAQPPNIANEYLVLLERFLHIENINEELYAKSNNRVTKIIQRNRKTYERVRTTYHKVKKLINRFTTK